MSDRESGFPVREGIEHEEMNDSLGHDSMLSLRQHAVKVPRGASRRLNAARSSQMENIISQLILASSCVESLEPLVKRWQSWSRGG